MRTTTLAMIALATLMCSLEDCAAEDRIIADFEGKTYGDWKTTGTAFGSGPANGSLSKQMPISNFQGKQLVNSFFNGDKSVGELKSPAFKIDRNYLSFLIGGGNLPDKTGIRLIIDGKTVRMATGIDSERLDWHSWNVSEFRGKEATLKIYDHATGGWGHICIDQIVLGNRPRKLPVLRMEEYRRSADYYREQYRPGYHFTPEMNWMNDPNGLVYFDGEYHLFYQHNPHGNTWGHMSWGHAVSRDLLHWKHLPIALHEEYGLMAFSGSCAADLKNTSGFGSENQTPLVAIFTAHGLGKQTQDLAYSIDRGRSWTKYLGNPVIDLNEKDFRDPKVFWHKPTKQWVMVVSLAKAKRLQFYGSNDLKSWKKLSEFGPAGVQNKPNWECPDLFELPIENEPGKTAWVLEADMGGGSVAGGSGGEYFVGQFDGTRFITNSKHSKWVDYGRDFYAPVSWDNIPVEDGRRIWIGWMNNWQTALNPTHPWRSAMSIPRELFLRRIDGELVMCQRPIRELKTLRKEDNSYSNILVDDGVHPADISGNQLEIHLDCHIQTAKNFGIRVLKDGNEYTEIGYDVSKKVVYVDRQKSGNVGFHPQFAGRHEASLRQDNDIIKLQILIDASSVEVFANDGEVVITDLVFPTGNKNRIEFFAKEGTAEFHGVRMFPLKSVWHDYTAKRKN